MSLPKEPRQQMINIMYLVLIALLAMNVSNEVIGAFKELDKGIVKNTEVLKSQFNSNKKSLFAAVAKNQTKVVYQERLPQVESINQDFVYYLDQLQIELKTAVAPPEKWENGWPKRLDDQEATTRIMIENKKGEELRARILQAKESYLNVFDEEITGKDTIFYASDKTAFNDEVLLGLNEVPEDKDWATFNFSHMPLVAVVTMLDKLKNDSEATAAAAVKRLKNKVTEKEIPFDQFDANIVPNATQLIQGDRFEAEIFLGASSSLSKPIIKVNGRTVTTDSEGRYNLSTIVNTVGPQKVNAEIIYKDGYGVEQTKKTTLSYNVIPPPNHAPLVSATAMNVLYMGLDNPISASIVGLRDNQVKVNMTGKGSINKVNGTGNYIVKVNEKSEVNIQLSGQNDRGESFNYSVPYRVKRVPSPVPMVGDCAGCTVRNGRFGAQTGLRVVLDDFVFEDVDFKIRSYTVTLKRAGETDLKIVKSKQGKFNNKIKRMVEDAKPGDKYFFEEIKVIDPAGKTRDLPSIVFNII